MTLSDDTRIPTAAEMAARRARLGIVPTRPVVNLPPRLVSKPAKPKQPASQPSVVLTAEPKAAPIPLKTARKAVVSLAVKVRFLWEGGVSTEEIARRLKVHDSVAEKLVEMIENEQNRADRRVTTKLLKHHVCEKLGFFVCELEGARRFHPLSCARQIVYWALARFTGLSLPQIGRQMGGRDHTTILHGVRRVDEMVRAEGKSATDFVGAIDAVDWIMDNLLVGGVWRKGSKA